MAHHLLLVIVNDRQEEAISFSFCISNNLNSAFGKKHMLKLELQQGEKNNNRAPILINRTLIRYKKKCVYQCG